MSADLLVNSTSLIVLVTSALLAGFGFLFKMNGELGEAKRGEKELTDELKKEAILLRERVTKLEAFVEKIWENSPEGSLEAMKKRLGIPEDGGRP